MKDRIIVDSCCDLTPQLKERLGAISIPLTMRLGQKEHRDDDSLDLGRFMAEMKANTGAAGSAAPAPQAYQEAMERAGDSYTVTLSSQLSASYQNAVIAKDCAAENGHANSHVFDSKSASAAETLIAVKLHELILQGVPRDAIISQVTAFIAKMKTYFVLEHYDNLQKNGRLGKVTGTLASILGIKLLMGADGDGNIALYAKPRGARRTLERMLSLVRESGKTTEGETMVISHCNNPELADQLATSVREQYDFKGILVVPTGGLSSLYADDKGIVMAF